MTFLNREDPKEAKIKCLVLHDMFRQFCGNPTSIAMIAGIYANQMIKKTENQLIDMYKRIKSEQDIVIEQIGDEYNKKGGKQADKSIKHYISLNISSEMSIKLLQ